MLDLKKTLAGAATVATLTSGALMAAAPSATAGDIGGVSSLPSGNTITSAKRAALTMRASSHAATGHRTLRIKTQKQARTWWCVPASSRAALTALGHYKKPPTQRSLARKMKTSKAKGGTSVAQMIRVVNKLQKRNYYAYSSRLSLSAYRYRVETGIAHYGAPSLLDVQAARLPWWRGKGVYGNHEVVAYGYRKTKSHFTMSAFEPWNNTRHRGAASSALYKASQNKDITW